MLSIKSVDVQSFKRAVQSFNSKSSDLLFLWEIGDESGIYRFILLLIRYGDTTDRKVLGGKLWKHNDGLFELRQTPRRL